MNAKSAFSVLIIGLFASLQVFGGENLKGNGLSEITKYEENQIQLKGKNIIVRFYNDLKNNPNSYSKHNISYENLSNPAAIITGTNKDISDYSVLVIIPQDQTDKIVADAMDDSVYAEKLDKIKSSVNLNMIFRKENQSQTNLFLEDAFGELLPSCQVKIFLQESTGEVPKIFIKEIKPQNGFVQVPKVTGSFRTYSFIVSHPDYGIALVESTSFNNHILTPLVHKDSEAYKRAVRGKIVDPDGKPVSGAAIQCQEVRTLGEGLISPVNGGLFKSLTNEKGEFSLYLPNNETPEERGYLIPPQSSYHVRIKAPDELSLLPFYETVKNDKEQLLVMEKADRFRKFVFTDPNGVITDPSKLQYINVHIIRKNKRSLSINYNEFIKGGYFPDGEYKANIFSFGGEVEFEPVFVDANFPEEIVFKIPGQVTYSGQVVHGQTGRPMSGAFVMAFNGTRKGNLSMITSEQWKSIHELPLEPSIDNEALKPVTDIYNIKKIIRTDSQGHFQMKFIPGEIYGFIAFDENYLGILQRRYSLTPDEKKIAEIPVMKLYPAVVALVNIKAEERISVNPKWIIDVKDNPSWVKEFLASNEKSEKNYVYDEWLEQNIQQSFHIPAGMNVRVRINSPYNDKWCTKEIPDVFNLTQGQTIDLGTIAFEPAIEVYVQVVNSEGKALEGIPVRTLTGSNAWSITHNTDDSGLSVFNVAPNSKGQFGILYTDSEGTYKREIINYEVKSRDDAGKMFTMKISGELLKLIQSNHSF